MVTRAELDGVLEAGGRLIGADGTDLGSIDQIVLDASGAAPAFVSVRAGFFGITQRFVPLDGASVDGSAVRVAFDADAIRSAPRVASDRGGLSEDQAAELRGHYGLTADSGTAEVTPQDAEAGSPTAEVWPPDAEVTPQDGEVGPPDAPVPDQAAGPPHPAPPAPDRRPAARPPRPEPPHTGTPPHHPGPPRPRPPHPGPPAPPHPGPGHPGPAERPGPPPPPA
ncbi:hypothetical protein [Sinomonas atrocyanea]|uniref:hypothetical protein n=1 Tax=Sinomonas atrocyanea TaxID=37927 RepID=UPI00278AC72C|nr:hypothetical protein [Sinomonas atrocyanea]MDQ0258866.1 hypothetical protein [Sinomonas atrocyanea]MDR6621053.1 hypothetical protein [Sinomonas atrocyanea]